MTSQIIKNVFPINRGYDTTIKVKYTEEAWVALGLSTGDYVAHFKQNPTDIKPLFVARSAGAWNTIVIRPDERMIDIKVTGEASKNWHFPFVYFDIVRIFDGAPLPIPGVWRWPVLTRVTQDV